MVGYNILEKYFTTYNI